MPYGFFDSPTEGILVLIEGEWYFYNGEGETGNLVITPNLGVILRLDWAAWLGMRGVPQVGGGAVEVQHGLSIIGLPEVPAAYQRPSDFLSI